MKRLLLTSDGLNDSVVTDFFIDQFNNNFTGIRACIVATKRRPEDQLFIDEARSELEVLGISTDVINISETVDIPHLSDYHIYYSCGGNTFYILDRMRTTGMDVVLKRAICAGKFYIGVSAGSIIPGPDIKISKVGFGGDANDIGLLDLTGFGLIREVIFPHFSERSQEELLDFGRERPKEPIVGITDAQALFVTDNETILIGEKGGLLFGDVSNIQDKTMTQ